jgi:FtsZ-interacting cell division protein ZipA
MGRLLIFVGVLAVLGIVLGLWYYALQRKSNEHKMGLTRPKQRIRELEADRAKRGKALKEIREIASSSETVSGDPLWSMVIDKVDMALDTEKDEENDE